MYRISRDLAVRVYRLTKIPPLCGEFGLADQIRRSAVSIPSNVAEAFALGTRPQLVRGIRIALGSAEELRTQLWIADHAGVVPAAGVPPAILTDLDRVTCMLIGLLKRYRARPTA